MSQQPLPPGNKSILFDVPPALCIDTFKHYALGKTAENNGIWLLFGGLINIGPGVTGGVVFPFNYVLILLGAWLVVCGAYGIIAKSREAYTLEGVSIAFVCGLNLFYAVTHPYPVPIFAVVLGVIQAYWTFRIFKYRSEFQSVADRFETVPDDMRRLLKAEIKSIVGRKPRPDVLDMTVVRFRGKSPAKAVLGTDRLLLLVYEDNDMLIMDKAAIAPLLLSVPAKNRGKATFQILLKDKMTTCTMKARDLARLQSWSQ